MTRISISGRDGPCATALVVCPVLTTSPSLLLDVDGFLLILLRLREMRPGTAMSRGITKVARVNHKLKRVVRLFSEQSRRVAFVYTRLSGWKGYEI